MHLLRPLARPMLRPMAAFGCLLMSLAAATAQTAPVTPAPAPAATPPAAAPASPPPILPFEDAFLKAAGDLLSKAEQLAGESADVVIDPLIDGATGAQSTATRSMERRITEMTKTKYTRLKVKPFKSDVIAKQPMVLIGTFTLINNAANKPEGLRDAYRICLVLADLKTNKVVAKAVSRAKPDGVDATPTPFFVDSPVWAKDQATEAYIKSCQTTKPGDPIDQAYADRIVSAALVRDAIEAYDAKNYKEALELYRSVQKTPGGEQLRVLNGIYLASLKLKRTKDANEAFGKVIDYSLGANKLSVKFLFRPGSTQFFADKKEAAPYSMWLAQIAKRAQTKNVCMEIVGHTSPTGPEPINQRLSTLRAEYVKDRITNEAPGLSKRIIANGVGSRETIIGNGKDNASDALDRRVEFKLLGSC